MSGLQGGAKTAAILYTGPKSSQEKVSAAQPETSSLLAIQD
jgi:hypothetical protein